MSPAANALAWQGLKRRALSLGAVKAFDQAMQFLLPVVLVRALDAATFGEYRLLWLAVGTLMAVATLNFPGSLYFFVPRSEGARRSLYVHQTIAFLTAAGLVCGFILSPLNPWLPAATQPLAQYGMLVPAFVALWVLTTLLDTLPTVEERIGWQAWATLTVSALRVVLLAVGAWFTGELRVILWLLLAVALVKLVLLLAYVRRWHGFRRPWVDRDAFAGQFKHAAPFGVSSALYALRGQADQWVAASLFALSSFAAFSIAAIVGQMVQLVRESVVQAFLPSMSRQQAAGDLRGMMQMNSRANLLVGSLLYPLLGFAFAFAEDIITLVYTAAYIEGTAAMRMYAVAMVAMVVEMGSVVLLLRQGRFALQVAGFALVVSVAVSWSAASRFGLAGAAAGSVLAIFIDRFFLVRRVARLTGIPVAALQDWRGLAWRLASAVLCAALAWAAVRQFLGDSGPMVRMAVGAALIALMYLPLNLRSGRLVEGTR